MNADSLDWASEAASRPARLVLWIALGLFAAILAWSAVAELDIIATARGRLVTTSSLQIVQPAETGILTGILVREGDIVRSGQVLARMDAKLSNADRRELASEIALRKLQQRRIRAELTDAPLKRAPGDPEELFQEVRAQYQARRQAHMDNIAAERAILAKAEDDLKSAVAVETKLRRTVPIYRQQEQAIDELSRDGFAGKLMLLERRRDRIREEQDLAAQEFNLASLRATIAQAKRKIAQIRSSYREDLQNERVDTEASLHRLEQDWHKLVHRQELLELKAPHEGMVKDLATRTLGSVVSAGTVLMTIVPRHEPLQAEVWVTHRDAGLVEPGQRARLKFAAYPFQHYGTLPGSVLRVSPDASELPQAQSLERQRDGLGRVLASTGYRARVKLDAAFLESGGRRYRLTPGMQVSAEVHLGTRSVLEYLLAPLSKTLQEAAREP